MIKALEASIQHWENNAVAERPEDASCLQTHCALCQRFNNDTTRHTCSGCPVAERTGQILCDGSPYGAASWAYSDWEAADSGPLSLEEFTQLKLAFQSAALEEVKFLESLLPPNYSELRDANRL